MLWTRWIIYGLPASLAALAAWSAHEAVNARAARENEIIIASGEGITPTLNPFLPACEADRRVTRLVHASLLRIDGSGHIVPSLARRWSWSQTSSVWFASPDWARVAMQRVQSLPNDVRAKLGIASVVAEGTELRLQFATPGASFATRLLPAIADAGPLPVETIRVELNEAARGYHDFFMKNAIEHDQVKGVWFDGAKAYELAVSGETVKFVEELNLFYQNRPALQANIRSTGNAPMLHRPVLELQLSEDAKFSDGSPFTADDVIATVSFLLSQPWPVPARDALRLIASMDAKDPHTLRVAFHEIYGPALMAFVDLPMLPASWLARHENNGVLQAFIDHPPPGAGAGRIESTGARTVFVQPKSGPRIEFLLGQPADTIRMGFAMHVVDCFWPRWHSLDALSQENDVVLRSTPPRNRLLVTWNCRKPPLNDPRVRQSLGMSVDRDAMVRELLHGQGKVHEGIFQPGIWFGQNIPASAFDPKEAARTLRELGWLHNGAGQLEKDGKVFRLELLTISGSPDRTDVAMRLRDAWSALGIETTVTHVAPDEFVNLRLPEHRFDAALLGLDFEKTWDQSAYWHSSKAHGGLNFSGLTDPMLDELLEAARAEFDLEKVPQHARAVEDRIVSFHPFFPLFSVGSPVAIRGDAVAELRNHADDFDLRGSLK